MGLTGVPSHVANIGDLYDGATETFSPSGPSIGQRRADALAALKAHHEAILAGGVSFQGKRIAAHEAARADLVAMQSVAMAALSNGLVWPSGYAQGWICTDNTRLPLPTPKDGAILVTAVFDWVSGLRNAVRETKDAILASESPEAVTVDWSSREVWEQSQAGFPDPVAAPPVDSESAAPVKRRRRRPDVSAPSDQKEEETIQGLPSET